MDILCVTVSRGVGNPPLDEVIIDFSPLRKKDIEIVARECVVEASDILKYKSYQSLTDNSNIDKLGWGETADDLLEDEVIWRIPVYSIVVLFSERADSKAYAEYIALKYADGISAKESKNAAAAEEREEMELFLKGDD